MCSHHRNDHTHTTPKRPPAPAMPPAAKNVAPAKGGKLNVLHGSAKVPDCPAVEVGGIAKDQVQVQDQGHDKEVLPNREFAEMRASAKVTPSFSILDGPNLNPNPNPHSLSWISIFNLHSEHPAHSFISHPSIQVDIKLAIETPIKPEPDQAPQCPHF